MVTMNDIVAFVEKAMENNLKVSVNNFFEYEITIYSQNYSINIGKGSKKQLIIHVQELNPYIINNLSDLDISAFEFLCARVKNYSQNKTLEYFNNFFKEEESKLKDINDLDDKED